MYVYLHKKVESMTNMYNVSQESCEKVVLKSLFTAQKLK